jgi:Sulfotransferase family
MTSVTLRHRKFPGKIPTVAIMAKRWRHQVNRALGAHLDGGADGDLAQTRPAAPAELTPAEPGSRLLPDPVFIICSVRSGSTLLRMLLNAHPAVHAPHELHLGGLRVHAASKRTAAALSELDIPSVELEHLLWDRVLHRELQRSGKQVLVEKTPNNALIWQRLVACWPDARFLFLLRHPATVAASWADAHAGRRSQDEVLAKVLKSMRAVEVARQNLPGITLRYEDLTADPVEQTRRICRFLGLDWDPAMLDYLAGDESFVRGLGDWREKIRSGQVQAARPVPTGPIPPELLDLCAAWGYLHEQSEQVVRPRPRSLSLL